MIPPSARHAQSCVSVNHKRRHSLDMVAFNPAALLIAFREGLEIALVIGILVSYLIRTDRKEQLPSIVAGTATALLLSGIIAIVMNQIGAELKDPYEQLFE